MSTSTRERVIDDFQGSDVLVLGTHFAPPTSGYIRESYEVGVRAWFSPTSGSGSNPSA